jgi:hypothetical protein
MSDRIHGLTVALDRDYRDDDVKRIVEAIEMIKGVQAVTMIVSDANDWINRTRIQREIEDKLLKALRSEAPNA